MRASVATDTGAARWSSCAMQTLPFKQMSGNDRRRCDLCPSDTEDDSVALKTRCSGDVRRFAAPMVINSPTRTPTVSLCRSSTRALVHTPAGCPAYTESDDTSRCTLRNKRDRRRASDAHSDDYQHGHDDISQRPVHGCTARTVSKRIRSVATQRAPFQSLHH